MKITLHQYRLVLRDTFQITHGSRDFQDTLLLSLHCDGLTGLGEAALISYYHVNFAQLAKALEPVRLLLKNYRFSTPGQLWEDVWPILRYEPFALCALDIAAHDLYGQMQGMPLYQLWQLDPSEIPTTNYTLGIGSLAEWKAKVKRFPWPVYKLKMDGKTPIAQVRDLQQSTTARLRLDANGGWHAAQAIANSQLLAEWGIELLEQPLPPDDLKGMEQLAARATLPLIADESCQTEADVANCSNFFSGINIKLPKCGGITPAKRMIAQAKALGMKTMIGCMTESSVGITAIAHLAPMLDYVDMDGAMLLAHDIAEGVSIFPDKVVFREAPGLGVLLKERP